MNLFHQVKTVLWSFIGLGQRRDMGEIPGRGNPLVLIAVAFVLVLLFLGALAFVAHMVVRGLT
jgi:hypothetical protein